MPRVADPVGAQVRRIFEATAHVTGEAFFAALAQVVAEVLATPITFIGELQTPTRMAATAVWRDGAVGAPFAYELAGSPCAGVVSGGLCQHPAQVQRLFPDDVMLVEMGIAAYFGVPIHAGDGTPLGIIVALDRVDREPIPDLDIVLATIAQRAAAEFERLRAERALMGSEARLRQLIETTVEGVWVIDEDNRTTLANEQMATMLGLTPAEMVGQPMFAFMDECARREATANVERRKRGIRERHEFRLRHASGADVWVVMASSPLPTVDGRYGGALAMVTDVTERRDLELRIQQAQKLESLAILAGGVAHDFNNLLVGVLGNANLARRQLGPDAAVAPMLADIETAALRAADLTRQMLAYSGRARFVVEPISLNAIVLEIGHLLGTVITKMASLELDLAVDPPMVEGDGTQLRQVVMNLVTNASDAIGDRPGVITITTGTRALSRAQLRDTYLDEALPEGRYAFCAVTDTGAGMDAATRQRIFDPFFTTKFAGRGLGLAATLGILRGHRGAIKVESAPGRGATFTVLLPERARAGAVPVAPTVGPSIAGTGLVLVIDDEAPIRRLASQVLELVGYEVECAADGADAVQRFGARPDAYACVVLDMTMPKLGGAETFAALRRLRPRLPVVLSSGYAEQEAARQVGADPTGFLAKPWSPDALIDAVARAITSDDG
ncbi:MAG: PAS domain S-box protein [Myxococcales bacterium]|nr:PAS domain S-box protein [Myxococcales bacterium]